MKSPCLLCPLLGEDKNSGECMNCQDRLAYVAAIGGMTHSVPDAMLDINRRRQSVATDDAIAPAKKADAETIQCSRCKIVKPRGEYYEKQLKKSSYWCKSCIGEYHRSRKNNAPTAPAHQFPPLPLATGAPANKVDFGRSVFLDFTAHPELLDDLSAWAAREFRTLEQQILYFLNEVRKRTPEMAR